MEKQPIIFLSLKDIRLIHNIVTEVFIDGIYSGFIVRIKIREKEYIVSTLTETEKPRIFKTLKSVFRFAMHDLKSKSIIANLSNYTMSNTDLNIPYSKCKNVNNKEDLSTKYNPRG